jgi:hypothetical protein
MPEIYDRDEKDFKESLDKWVEVKDKAKPIDTNYPTVKPLLVPMLLTSAVDRPRSRKKIDAWKAEEIDTQMADAKPKSNGIAHFAVSALRDSTHGGPADGPPNDDHNVAQKVGARYKHAAQPPVANKPTKPLPPPDAKRDAGTKTVRFSLTVPTTETVRWWAWGVASNDPQKPTKYKRQKKDVIELDVGVEIEFQAISESDQVSPVGKKTP